MSIQLTRKQEEAVKICVRNFNQKKAYSVISGYAGSGKSTVVKFVVDALKIDPEDIRYVTFTGKAAQVLYSKGHSATTIHKLIYQSYMIPATGKFVYRKRPKCEVRAKVLIIDEVSMVPANLLRDLASYGIHMIMLGDPGQLPPIGMDNGMLKNPDVFLDEIMRQALDNSIIYLSMLIREGKPIPKINDEFVRIVDKKDFSMGMVNWADQVICGRNDTRKMVNHATRQAKGFTDVLPQVGDKMICLRNDWETMNDEGMPIVNGTIGFIEEINKKGGFDTSEPVIDCGPGLIVDFKPDFTESFSGILIDPNIPRGMDSVLQQQISAGRRNPESIYQELDYGYAITCHKSQGSEFEKVVVLEEILRGDQHKNWLYTAVTRASQKLVLVAAPEGSIA